MYILGKLNEAKNLKGVIDDAVWDYVYRDCEILDIEYGNDRDYFTSGGFAIIIETSEDFVKLKKLVDFDVDMYEFVNVIIGTVYLSAVYVINDDFAISVFMPLALAPKSIIEFINAERKDLL